MTALKVSRLVEKYDEHLNFINSNENTTIAEKKKCLSKILLGNFKSNDMRPEKKSRKEVIVGRRR